MGKVCEICGKKQMSGNNVAHSHKKTRRKWNINLQKIKAGRKTITVCTRCIKAGKVTKIA